MNTQTPFGRPRDRHRLHRAEIACIAAAERAARWRVAWRGLAGMVMAAVLLPGAWVALHRLGQDRDGELLFLVLAWGMVLLGMAVAARVRPGDAPTPAAALRRWIARAVLAAMTGGLSLVLAAAIGMVRGWRMRQIDRPRLARLLDALPAPGATPDTLLLPGESPRTLKRMIAALRHLGLVCGAPEGPVDLTPWARRRLRASLRLAA